MASESTQNSSSTTFSMFIASLLGFSTNETRPEPGNPSPEGVVMERLILINPATQRMVVMEGVGLNLDGLFGILPEKDEPPPAAKSAIEAMPSVEIGAGVDGECAICLEEWVEKLVVKEMPCKHRFHGGCIEKWLGMHGSCPVCRYAMPTEERENKGDNESETQGEGQHERRREIWVSFTLGRTEEERQSGGEAAMDSTDESASMEDID